uniref:Cysteine-rich venom protein n=1 Tax=Strigamia maritima TaxID=126957 RepID=T1IJJ5_STRMM
MDLSYGVKSKAVREGFLTALLFLCLTIASTVLGCDYAQFGEDHTMCQYVSEACGAIAREFSSSETEEAVRLHNEKRQYVASGQQSGQPSASNMKQLMWDDELATIAQRWADQCTFNHDDNRRTQRYHDVGQNSYISASPSSDGKIGKALAEAVNGWYNEVTNPGFDSENIDPYQFNSGTGHYTQMLWAETATVGCGYSFYTKNGNYIKLIICNYGPGGNMIDGSMYKPGDQCSICTNGCSEEYDALCKLFVLYFKSPKGFQVWDAELATIAQRWADQCIFNHDKNRRTQKYSYVGQNAYIAWSTDSDSTINMSDAIDSWYDEVTKPGFSSNNINPFKFSSGAGHYTQMVWAETSAVGCGYSFYKENGYNTRLIICNYGPGGNMRDASMYKTGRPCSACTNGCSGDYNSALCSFSILFGLMLTTAITFACEYIKFGSDHTMCSYTNKACKITKRKYSKSEAAKLVDLHNKKRQFVASGKQKGQPKASNMNQLYWDEELAILAQRWADQCKFTHDKNRRSKKHKHVGQNIYLYSWVKPTNNANTEEAIDAWYKEVVTPGFSKKHIHPFKISPGVGHYTQLVWAETRLVGCGYSFYFAKNVHNKLLVCNYGPSGNELKGEMYKQGKPGTECTNGSDQQEELKL